MTIYKTRVFNDKGKVIKSFYQERNSSKGELKIEEWFISNNIEYEKEKRFSWLLGVNNGEMRLDFYIPSLKLAIEFDGPHHDTSDYQKKNDVVKNQLVKAKGIKMIRIHHTRFSLIDKILARYIPVKKVKPIVTKEVFYKKETKKKKVSKKQIKKQKNKLKKKINKRNG